MYPRNLPELLQKSSQRYSRRTAIIFGQKVIDYKTLDETTSAIAAGLRKQGIKKGDRIALYLDNCPEFIISYYAILKAQATLVPINFMYKIEEAKYIIEDSKSVCIITSRLNLDAAQEISVRSDCLKQIITVTKVADDIPDLGRLAKTEAHPCDYRAIDSHDPAVIMYTSGTTGHPKGAILTHHNLVANAIDSKNAVKITSTDTFICVLPLFHAFAATVCMNLPLAIGAKIVVMKTLKPFKRVIRAIRKNNVSIFVGIPSIFSILKNMKFPTIMHTPLIFLFNPVRICISGAASLPKETFSEFEKKFRIPLIEGYGLTEASPVVTFNPLHGIRKPGSIGLPLAKHIRLKVVDDSGKILPPEQIGELLIQGPSVMSGYLNQPEATKETLKNGWLYTGDMAKIDADGYVYIVGRKKEMINVRGLNVYPREIEETLYRNPKIKECAIIGIEDPHRGEVPKGFIVLKEGEHATEQEILHYLHQRIATYKIPKRIEFRPFLPKNATGKILKRALEDEKN
ncbi:MAG TPA: long-chain fatty acid--CoA ligase [Candidatus Omnitrophota bacterium]|nr:long-chain fatty acid--CoA ligase [Candidatus Omnitrophota bacterium]HPT07655.1 long-chain fatty acid--CoA ligase [Candidatus Omnitrophota bacterium]